MIKVSANILKKVPTPGVQYSTQAFGASMEIEVADAADPQAVRHRLRSLYQTIAAAIDEQIARVGPPGRSPAICDGPTSDADDPPRPDDQLPKNNGRNRAGFAGATKAQQRAVFAIAKQAGLDLSDVLARCGAGRVEELSFQAASRLIDELKAEPSGR